MLALSTWWQQWLQVLESAAQLTRPEKQQGICVQQGFSRRTSEHQNTTAYAVPLAELLARVGELQVGLTTFDLLFQLLMGKKTLC